MPLEALNPELSDILPLLAAGPLLAGNWPLFVLLGWAGLSG
jgi:hypothetical protein